VQEPGLQEPYDFSVIAPMPGQPAPGAPDPPDVIYRNAEAKFSQLAFDPAAEKLLRGAEAVTKAVFNVPSLHFEKAVTERVLSRPQWGDVLIAEWSIDEAFGKGTIILTATPYFSDYAMRLSDCKIGSQAELAAFLQAFIGRPGSKAPLDTANKAVQMLWPKPTVGYSFSGVPFFAGSRLGTSQLPLIADFNFWGQLRDKEWYLHFGIGKSYSTGGVSAGLAYIPERFPPLADLIKSWGSGQIRREVGDPVKPFEGVPAFTDRRDQILIAELARRGLSDEQVADLLTDVHPAPKSYGLRLRSFIGGYVDSGKGPWLAVFAPALKAYEGVGPAADAGVLELFSDAGRLSCPASVEQQALDVLKKGVFSRGPFAYLGRCSTSLQTVAALESLSPGDEAFEKSRAGVIAMIRQRIANPRKGPIRPGQAK
jgi:hypothetical protein